MQEDERDVLEVLIFDEIEETVGTCCARSFSVWKKSRRLFEEITTRSKPQAAKH
jgi:hypothetical protein